MVSARTRVRMEVRGAPRPKTLHATDDVKLCLGYAHPVTDSTQNRQRRQDATNLNWSIVLQFNEILKKRVILFSDSTKGRLAGIRMGRRVSGRAGTTTI